MTAWRGVERPCSQKVIVLSGQPELTVDHGLLYRSPWVDKTCQTPPKIAKQFMASIRSITMINYLIIAKKEIGWKWLLKIFGLWVEFWPIENQAYYILDRPKFHWNSCWLNFSNLLFSMRYLKSITTVYYTGNTEIPCKYKTFFVSNMNIFNPYPSSP